MGENGHRQRSRIGITLGDPHGIGAEVIAKSLADPALRLGAQFIIYGLHEALDFACDLAELRPYWRRLPHEDAVTSDAEVALVDFDDIDISSRSPRKPSAEAGKASMLFLEQAVNDAAAGRIDALVTGPINKTSWLMAGYPFEGHTEMLSHRFKRHVTMMFAGGPLRVALASIHEPLFELRNHFSIGLVFQPIDHLHHALRDWFGVERPRIAVAGINPHAGENGRFGDEEVRVIQPAVEMAVNAGIDATGPYPADTLFWRASQGEFDGVVAMYHDQALIPVKLLAFDQAVNLTLGLPIIRTSVDHGTAFDIVGKNKANPGSMKEAVRLAIQLAEIRRANNQSTEPRISASAETARD